MVRKPTYEELVKRLKELEKKPRERRLSRKFLRENEKHYHRLLEYNPAAIAIHDRKDIVYMNATGLALLGATNKEDIIGKPVLDFIHPDSRKTAIKRMAQIYKDSRYGESIRSKLRRIDGKSVEAMVRGIPAEFNGKQTVYAVFLDITKQVQAEEALKQSEEKYRSIFENIPISIILINKDGQIIDINPYHLNNITNTKNPKDNFIGKNITTHPPFINTGLIDYYKRLLKGESFTINDMHSPTIFQGPAEYFNVNGIPLFKEGEVAGAVVMLEDITKRRQRKKNS